MSSKEILEKAIQLKPHEKFALIEGLLRSLDEPNKNIDEIWAIEAEKRLDAYREGRLKGVPMEEIFTEEK
jgi:putative addiction module component (TIGR02574 family)